MKISKDFISAFLRPYRILILILSLGLLFGALSPLLLADTEQGLAQAGRALIGKSTAEVLKLKGPPARKILKTYGPGMGPDEALGDRLKDGEQYEEWDYQDGDWHLLLWFYPVNQDRPAKVLDSGIHKEGWIY